MVSVEKVKLLLGLLAFCTGVIVVLQALLLGFHIENSDRAMADSAKGQVIAVPAVLAVAAGIVTLAGRRHRWSLVVGGVAVGAAAVAVLLSVLLPGG